MRCQKQLGVRFGLLLPALLLGITPKLVVSEEFPLTSISAIAAADDLLENYSPPPEIPPQAVATPLSPYESDLWESPYLLGNLWGVRDEITGQGVMANVYSTQFFQGVASGGAEQEFVYSGRMDYLINVDGEKAGLWKGFFVSLHGETRYGQTVNVDSGALIPPNGAMLFPTPSGTTTALTGVKFTQALSESFVTFAGKINLLDELKQPYAAGRGVDAFMNLGLVLPVTAARTLPYSTLGAGFAYLREGQPFFTMMLLDTHNTPTTSGFESLFSNGATILSRIDVPVTLFGLPGHQGFWGTYSSGTYSDLQPTAYFDPNAGLIVATGRDTGSWGLFYSADQALFVDPCNSNRSWGVFTNLGLADNGPSPIRWSANVGIGGSSPLACRPLDTFGIGYSYVNYSSPVQNLAPILLPIGNDHAVEFFYNYAVTPWFRLTPDLQILVPARERTLPPGARNIDTAILLGMRAKLDF